jgi:6-phosphogluconolactonase
MSGELMNESAIIQDSEIVRVVAEQFVSLTQEVIGAEGRFRLALAGGSTPRALYEVLAGQDYRARVDWPRVEFYQGDERAVGPTHADSNWGMADRALIKEIEAEPHQLFRMEGEGHDPDISAARYEGVLRRRLPQPDGWGVFDLILLGIGTDGHTASLFPGTAALEDNHRWVLANHVPALKGHRYTLTFPVLNAAKAVWFLVTGEEKAGVLRRIIRDRDPALPATRVAPTNGSVTWFVDETAGKLL